MKAIFRLSIPTIGYKFQISLECARDILGDQEVFEGYNQRTMCIRMHIAYFENKAVVRLDINGRWFYISENENEINSLKICKGIIGEQKYTFYVNEIKSEWVKYTTDVFVQLEIV